MKSILLASASIIAFAGAAAAEGHLGVTFTGSAELGYNDTDQAPVGNDEDNVGFYSDLDITANFAAELDNGLTAAASIDLEDLADSDTGETYELSLTSETAGLFYGDTNFAAQNIWVAAGDMESDGFSEADGEQALRGEVTFGGVDAQISYVLADADDVSNDTNGLDDLEQLSIGIAGDFGNVNVALAYQEEVAAGGVYNTANGDFNENEVFGLSVGTSFSGADIRLAYAEDEDSDSIGINVAYPFGPVTATVYYVSESVGDDNYGLNLAYENGPVAVTFDYDNDQGVDKFGLEGSYEVGNGLTVYAGYLTEDGVADAYYLGGEYDLGGGASLEVSYADADDEADDDDDVGAQDYQVGTTVELSFEF